MQSWRALPAEVYTLVERTAGAVLLESAPGSPASRLFLDPLRVVEARAADSLPQLFRDIEDATAAGMHAAGFLAYECGAALEPSAANKPAMRPNAAASIRAPQNPLQASLQDMPLAWFGIYRQVWVFDHGAGSFVDGDPPGMAGMRVPDAEAARIEMAPELHEAAFARRIAAIHEWIRAGDVYQLNFTFPLRGRAMGGAAAVYARLRARQPVEYGALVHWREGRQVLSFSPELFFAIENSPPPAIPTPMDEIGCPRSLAFGDRGKQDFNPTQFLSRGAALAPPTRRITTRPMKGTARRGRTTAEDAAIAAGLRADEKNCAENVMIVDLLRNDLGRLCRFGSVRAEELFAVERHPTLWQMTSTVTGELRADVGIAEIVQALFPCGSVTGAPKVRAMQLIADLEDGPRDVYTGAIGHFSPERTVFNVAIRTLDIEGEHARMGVGSGVVIDSDAGDEYRECLLKAAFLASDDPEFAPEFALIETLAWRAGYPLLEMHLDRLEDSARYFGFACERDAVRAALLHAAKGFDGAR
ncbi:MAG TPA: chorismate-binding protein, partial [Terracidiphilus sp.]|nr:chorismate-binding protein [Terracidiphilus sp.]